MFLTGWIVYNPKHPPKACRVHRTRSEAISSYLSNWYAIIDRDRRWKYLKRRGYVCFKVKVTGAPNERTPRLGK